MTSLSFRLLNKHIQPDNVYVGWLGISNIDTLDKTCHLTLFGNENKISCSSWKVDITITKLTFGGEDEFGEFNFQNLKILAKKNMSGTYFANQQSEEEIIITTNDGNVDCLETVVTFYLTLGYNSLLQDLKLL